MDQKPIGTASDKPNSANARPAPAGVGRHAFLVASGIFLSKIAGLVRERAIAYFLGNQTIAADALRGALRLPNILQNLFGEGVLSASFIPVYARLLAEACGMRAAMATNGEAVSVTATAAS